MPDSNATGSGLSIATAIFLIFLVLKLTGLIDWSWLWVTAPLWWWLGLIGAVLLVTGIAAAIAYLCNLLFHGRNVR